MRWLNTVRGKLNLDPTQSVHGRSPEEIALQVSHKMLDMMIIGIDIYCSWHTRRGQECGVAKFKKSWDILATLSRSVLEVPMQCGVLWDLWFTVQANNSLHATAEETDLFVKEMGVEFLATKFVGLKDTSNLAAKQVRYLREWITNCTLETISI